MTLDLTDAWAKLDRAKRHVDDLRAGITKVAYTKDLNAIPIPLRRQYEVDLGAVVYRISSVIHISDDWPLLAGDAIENFRAALDYLMWQLAVLKLGRQPTQKEASAVQFSVANKATQFTPPRNRYLAHVRQADIARLKTFQPYYHRHLRKKGQLHPLPKLVHLSNVDKHRRLHLLVVAPAAASFTNRADAFRDCVPVLFPAPEGRMLPRWNHTVPGRSPRPNQEILRIDVTPTGPHPDVEVDASITCQIRIGKLGPVIPMLDGFGQYVAAVLTAFKPRP